MEKKSEPDARSHYQKQTLPQTFISVALTVARNRTEMDLTEAGGACSSPLEREDHDKNAMEILKSKKEDRQTVGG